MGGEGGGRMERRLSRRACAERECHTYTDTWCVCVWHKGKPSCSTGGGGGFSFLTVGQPQNGNKGMPQEAEQGAGRIHHNVHYLLTCRST